MSTKAFTSALGYGITVRGYIDEDDKLVLLEPEGSGGGGGDLKTAELLITNNSGVNVTFPIADDGLISAAVTSDSAEDPFTVPVVGSGCVVAVSNPDTVEITTNGDIALTDPSIPGIYTVTGDASITLRAK